jgi:hypothetical protein
MPLGSASVLNIYGYNSFETNPLNLHVLRQHSLKKHLSLLAILQSKMWRWPRKQTAK